MVVTVGMVQWCHAHSCQIKPLMLYSLNRSSEHYIRTRYRYWSPAGIWVAIRDKDGCLIDHATMRSNMRNECNAQER
jgi:hypothetical protein